MAKSRNVILKVFCLEAGFDRDEIIVSYDVMKKMSSLKSIPKVLAIVKKPDESITNKKRLIFLDGIQDPGNMGTIIRTATAFGFDGIIASYESADFYNQKTIMASQGTIFSLPLVRMSSTDFIAYAKENKYQIIASSLEKDSGDIKNLKVEEKYILVIGSEGQGISEIVLKGATNKVIIPINNVDSLNAGVAAGILMYQVKQNTHL
ncbi:MAG: RNA methyltransferase [Bacilli bacterium]|jgi:TrmH family RNA methyltransferase|nr:RNA methyltransferase [Bacilli bacterium]